MQPLRRRLVEPHGKRTWATPKPVCQGCVASSSLGQQLRLEQQPQLHLGLHARHPQPLWAQLPQLRPRHPQSLWAPPGFQNWFVFFLAKLITLAALSYVTAVRQTRSTLYIDTSRKIIVARPSTTMSRKVCLKACACRFFAKKMHQRVNRPRLSFRLTIVIPTVGKRSGNGSKTLSQDGYGRVTFCFRDYAGDCSPTRCFERPFSIISVMHCNASNA